MVSSVKGKSSHSGNEVNARGDSSSRTEISETSAHGLRISTSGRSSILIRRMIVSVAAACGIAVMFGGECVPCSTVSSTRGCNVEFHGKHPLTSTLFGFETFVEA